MALVLCTVMVGTVEATTTVSSAVALPELGSVSLILFNHLHLKATSIIGHHSPHHSSVPSPPQDHQPYCAPVYEWCGGRTTHTHSHPLMEFKNGSYT